MAKIATVLRNRHFAVHKITLNPNFVKLTSLTDAPQKTVPAIQLYMFFILFHFLRLLLINNAHFSSFVMQKI